MEAVIKFNIIDSKEEDWILDEYANGKLHNLTDEHLTEVIMLKKLCLRFFPQYHQFS